MISSNSLQNQEKQLQLKQQIAQIQSITAARQQSSISSNQNSIEQLFQSSFLNSFNNQSVQFAQTGDFLPQNNINNSNQSQNQNGLNFFQNSNNNNLRTPNNLIQNNNNNLFELSQNQFLTPFKDLNSLQPIQNSTLNEQSGTNSTYQCFNNKYNNLVNQNLNSSISTTTYKQQNTHEDFLQQIKLKQKQQQQQQQQQQQNQILKEQQKIEQNQQQQQNFNQQPITNNSSLLKLNKTESSSTTELQQIRKSQNSVKIENLNNDKNDNNNNIYNNDKIQIEEQNIQLQQKSQLIKNQIQTNSNGNKNSKNCVQKVKRNYLLPDQVKTVKKTNFNTSHVPINMINNLTSYLIRMYKDNKIPCQCLYKYEDQQAMQKIAKKQNINLKQDENSQESMCKRCLELKKLVDLKKSKIKNIQSMKLIWNSKRIRILTEDYLTRYCYSHIQSKIYRSSNNKEALIQCLPSFLSGVRDYQQFWKLI